MMVAVWIVVIALLISVVIVIALLIFGPMLLEMWRTPGDTTPEAKRRPWREMPAWQQYAALAVVVGVIILSVLSYLGFFGLS